jgi:hypothetical protein
MMTRSNNDSLDQTAAAVCEHCLFVIDAADRRGSDEDLRWPIPLGGDAATRVLAPG